MKNKRWLLIPVVLLVVTGIIMSSCTTSTPTPSTSAAPSTSIAPTTSAAPKTTSAAPSTPAATTPATVLKLRYQYYGQNVAGELTNLQKLWVDRIEEVSKGTIKFERYFVDDVVGRPEMYNAVTKGVLDLIVFPTAYFTGNIPWINWGSLLPPGDFGKVRSQGILDLEQAALAKDNMQVIGAFVNMVGSSGIAARKAYIKKMEDFKGLKVRASNPQTQLEVKALGGAPVNVSAAEAMGGGSSGLVDADWAYPIDSMLSTKYYEIFPYITYYKPFSTIPNYWLINLNTWKKIPADIQKQIVALDAEMQQWRSDKVLIAVDAAFKQLEKLGIPAYMLPDDEFARWNALFLPERLAQFKTIAAASEPAAKMMSIVQTALGVK